jgi:hypothetical protein
MIAVAGLPIFISSKGRKFTTRDLILAWGKVRRHGILPGFDQVCVGVV